MHKKDYVAVAQAIKAERDIYLAFSTKNKKLAQVSIEALDSLAIRLAYMFEQDNLHFVRSRFLLACGFKQEDV